MLNALTIELEDWFQNCAVERLLPVQYWEHLPGRLEAQTYRLLALLEEAGVKATFFVLGWNAERYPQLVAQIERGGHELAIHGYQHVILKKQTPVQFSWEVAHCQEIMAQIAGRRARGFRAAGGTVAGARWALEILLENGIEYESSAAPAGNGVPRDAHRVMIDSKGTLLEFPVSTPQFAGGDAEATGDLRLPLLKHRQARRLIMEANRRGKPAVACLYPWELEQELPRCLLGRGAAQFDSPARRERRLTALLREFQFAPAAQVLASGQDSFPCLSVDDYGNQN